MASLTPERNTDDITIGKDPQHTPIPTSSSHHSPHQNTALSEKRRSPEPERQPLHWVIKQPPGRFTVNCILQIAAFGAAIGFGIFAIKSVNVAKRANYFAEQANNYSSRANELAEKANLAADQANNYSNRANVLAENAKLAADQAYDMAIMANRLTLLTLCLTVSNEVSWLFSHILSVVK